MPHPIARTKSVVICLSIIGLAACGAEQPKEPDTLITPPAEQTERPSQRTFPVVTTPSITGVWNIISIDDTYLSAPESAQPSDLINEMQFDDNEFIGRLSCAFIKGRYQTSDSGISMTDITITSDKCGKADVERASRFADILRSEATRYEFEGSELTFEHPELGETLWRLEPGTNGPTALPDLLGVWQISKINGAPALLGADDRPPGVFIGPFRIGVDTGCNSGGAEVRWQDHHYEPLGSIVTTEMACEGLMEQESLLYDLFRAPVFVRDGTDFLATSSDGNTARLSRTPKPL